MGRAETLTKILKRYDSELYARSHKPPRIDVYRQSVDRLGPPHYVFSLTDNWNVLGTPVEWGIEPILARLKAIDLWNSGIGIDEMHSHNDAIDKSKERDFRNNVESFMYEFRRDFKRATGDINTANLKKLYRKENSNEYCEPRS